MEDIRAAAILLAAGAGRRVGADQPKAFLTIGGRPILSVAAGAAAASPAVSQLVVTAPTGWEEQAEGSVEGLGLPVTIVTGGATRQASVRAALAGLSADVEAVAVHDAARPFAPPELFTEVIGAVAAGAVGAIPIVPIPDTVKRVRDGSVVQTESRAELALAQTPQAFRTSELREAHEQAARAGLDLTDDAAVMEWAGFEVRVVAGDPMNVKITTFLDLVRADERMGGSDV